MGQKINPIGLRLGINRTWDSRWFANKSEYGALLQEDLKIRAALLEDLKQRGTDPQTLPPHPPDTFRHPALALFRESGDLADAVIECYRQALESNEVAGVVGRLQNGNAFLAERARGRGRVAQLFVPLDRTAGNLVVRHSFLPLIQELTAYLAQPVVATLNIPPSRGAARCLHGRQRRPRAGARTARCGAPAEPRLHGARPQLALRGG